MWKNLNKATTTTILAVIFVICGFGILYGSGSGSFQATESLQTQIVQGVYGLLMLIAGFFFGSSNNKEKTDKS